MHKYNFKNWSNNMPYKGLPGFGLKLSPKTIELPPRLVASIAANPKACEAAFSKAKEFCAVVGAATKCDHAACAAPNARKAAESSFVEVILEFVEHQNEDVIIDKDQGGCKSIAVF